MEQSKGYARVHAAQPLGIDAELVTVEADLSRGLHAFSIVGLADKAVGEARDRISSAIKNAGFKAPKSTNRRIVLSLSPASLRKDGSQYDLPLAIAYLVAAGFVHPPGQDTLFCGELGLDGSIRPVRSVLAHVLCARKAGLMHVYVPAGNAQEALLVRGITIYPVDTLGEIIAHLNGVLRIPPAIRVRKKMPRASGIDFALIQGQESAKRALLIAACGRHNVMLYGPPGTGKTLLARAFPSILPGLPEEDALTATAIHGAAGELAPGSIIAQPPFRTPHHTISTGAMIGGSQSLRPGEVSLAHAGVLFMDEFIEFDARTLESLRQPLEDKKISIARVKGAYTLPADFILVAAMNPADTLAGDDTVIRQKSRRQAQKLSRPIIDRIDLWVEVPRIEYAAMGARSSGLNSDALRKIVESSRAFADTHARAGDCTQEAHAALQIAAERGMLSPRSTARVMRVARTIASIEGVEQIGVGHVVEALQYRPKAPFV